MNIYSVPFYIRGLCPVISHFKYICITCTFIFLQMWNLTQTKQFQQQEIHLLHLPATILQPPYLHLSVSYHFQLDGGHGRLRLDKKSIIRQYRNLQRAKTKSNIVSHYTVHVLRTTNHTYFETFSKK